MDEKILEQQHATSSPDFKQELSRIIERQFSVYSALMFKERQQSKMGEYASVLDAAIRRNRKVAMLFASVGILLFSLFAVSKGPVFSQLYGSVAIFITSIQRFVYIERLRILQELWKLVENNEYQ